MRELLLRRFALSPEQRDAWLRYGTGCIGCVITINGSFGRDRLDEALRAVVAEHEILRTRFDHAEGFDAPLQVIDPPPASQLKWVIRPIDDTSHELDLRTSCLNADAETLGHLAAALARRLGSPDPSAPSAPGPVQYADYAAWANDQAAAVGRGKAAAAARDASIKSQAAGCAAVPASELAHVSCALSVRVGQVPDEATALAAWIALWRAHGDHEQVLIYRDGRVSPELASALGPFERWVPFAVSLPEGASTREAIEHVVHRLAACSARASWPVGAVAGVGFRYGSALKVGGWSMGAVSVPGAPCGLMLTVTAGQARLTYARAAWSGAVAARLLDQYRTLVGAAACAGPAPWRTWTVGPAPVVTPAPAAVPDMVTAICTHASRQPAHEAVRVGPAALTYGGLMTAAAGWGAAVAEYGPEARIGLLGEPSVETVAAWVGLLGAGVTVVPLDPAATPGQLASQVVAGRLAALVTPAGVATLPADLGPVITTPAPAEGVWPRAVLPLQLAYVLLTSGSTGTPKGVGVTHGALAHYAASLAARLAPAPEATWTLISPLTVDLGYTSLVGALTTGGTLWWRTAAEALVPETVGGADYLKITPTHLAALLAGAAPSVGLPRVALLLGGEAPAWALVDEVARRAPGLTVFNHYGPTEATVGVLLDRITPEAEGPRPAAPLLGRPLAHVTTAVLDATGDPVLPGAPGELWVGGPSVARGYEHDPARTADAFRPDPSGPPGARRYATGDRVRVWPDGRSLFLGRRDRQIKVRGHRLDPDAIEAVLRCHPAVAQALVLPRNDTLAAYLVPSGATKPSLQALRRMLEENLPPHMVPAHLLWIADTPRTASGKIDASQLPDPRGVPDEVSRAVVHPENNVERLLLDVWTSVLNVAHLGVLDNFFLAGGDSIASIQVVARASQRGLHITPKQLFDYPTIRALASVARPVETRAAASAVTPGDVPLTPIQHWFFDGQPPEPHHYNQAIWLDAREPLDLSVLHAALQAVMDHHDALRLRFVPALDGWRQEQRVEPESVPLDVIRVPAGSTAASVAPHALRYQATLNLVRGPLFRAVLVRSPDGPERLLLVAHHLVVDGLSWVFLLEDLQRAYLQLRAGAPAQLAPKTSAYRTWAEYLAGRVHALAISPAREAWLELLSRPIAPFPPAAGGGSMVETAEDAVHQWLPAEATRRFLDAAAGAYSLQPQEALLAAFFDAYRAWSGQKALLVDIESHGRDCGFGASDVSRTVGWFTVRCPLRLEHNDDNPAAMLKGVKEVVRSTTERAAAYGLLRYVARDAAFEELPEASVSVNYFGHIERAFPAGSPFVAFSEEHATSRARSTPRRFRLDVNLTLELGQLHVRWGFGPARDRREDVDRLAERFAEAIARLTAHCLQPDAGGFTPSDFPAAGLSQGDLDRLLSEWSRDFS